MQGLLERTHILLGDEKLARLQNARVFIAGLGGVGSFAAEALARMGVGHLTLVDCDVVAASNINRQLVALNSTIGQKKADIMAACA
jgi:tRNA A37 threonylcarbamoyladenosine dehydratase